MLNISEINKVVQARLFREFFNSEKAGGFLLIACTLTSILLANSAWQSEYLSVWKTPMAGHSVHHWINDGLMAIFFLLIGLELEREIYAGELSSVKNASLPFFAALGGMLVPAGIYAIFNYGSPAMAGAGIPMATDIAFAIGILSLLGKGIPASVRIFLTALAVMDDLGAIILIAIAYTKNLIWINLIISLGIFVLLIIFNRLKVRNLLVYLAGGVVMWYFMLQSGVHATVTGVLLAFAIPFGDGGERSPSYVLQHHLHKPVAFIILPLFALANTALVLEPGWYQWLGSPMSLGIIAGLFIGKPLGIYLLSRIAVATGICNLPAGSTWKHIAGVGFLGGIGFTMSIFIALLALDTPALTDAAKMAILVSSLLSGVVGYLWLKFRAA